MLIIDHTWGQLDASYHINRIWIYISVNLYVTIRRFHTLMSVGRKKLLVCEKNVAPFSCCGKVFISIICNDYYHNIIIYYNYNYIIIITIFML